MLVPPEIVGEGDPKVFGICYRCQCMAVQLVDVLMGVVFLLTVRTLHFCGWNNIFHTVSNRASRSRSSCRSVESLSDAMVRYALVSSANSLTVDFIPSCMSLM